MATALKSLHLKNVTSNGGYVGRFAPSPSGQMHFGSLVTALGSFLQAKSQNGQWLLRIEDIDPPREVAGASESILRCLEAHHLFWDHDVVYQSDRSDLYNEKIQYLTEQGFTYHCQCSRAHLVSLKFGQACVCADLKLNIKSLNNENSAIRFRHHNIHQGFYDELLGQVNFPKFDIPAQFAIKRKDNLFAYQLAVVVDDIQQGITQVARGADLLGATLFQLALYQAFDRPAPTFLHFPVVVTEPGKKLSKQNHAREINTKDARANLINALGFFGILPTKELQRGSVQNILNWAICEWDLRKIPAKTECIDNRIGHADSI
ncbi:tRNA glutamyl-Q(34) synthetase GluQRS [Paraglaciecola sp. MB-3u-78]|jgi:glutamyl-Q tRNA(Asp) synthetase|uniref:tRNA glutamyl-Q(34) synthetase GluQRS n=1 Tax=Paraglaciecola sp. MB-3u-78 TaxID=2058332 RepID=UPI000C33839C|nr:tRNA glutamyl-Q(34) synthetase GluQRS [Paraglaciecola sp. MB-3u-78]PKG98309.1 tRNA glutamyl-Q(34) synthetase GluQRS [Paraglaciecola sp. MB-3u-78]